MKIKDILEELDKTKLATLVTTIDGIAEKPLRTALKAAGCKPKGSGKSGWFYAGNDASVLEKSIFHFHKKPIIVVKKETTKEHNNVTTNEQKNQRLNELTNVTTKELTNESTKEPTKQRENEPMKVPTRKRYSFDLDSELMKQLKMKSVTTDINVYELVEDAIRKFLLADKT